MHKKIPILILLLIITSPLSKFYFNIKSIPFAITPFRVTILLSICLFILKVALKQKIKVQKPVFFIIILIIVMYTFSLLRTDNVFKDTAYFQYLVVLVFFISILVIVDLVDNKKKLYYAIKYVLIISLLISVIGYLEIFLKFKFGINIWETLSQYQITGQYQSSFEMGGKTIPRMTGSLGDSNLLSFYLFFPFSILAFEILQRKKSVFIRNRKLAFVLFAFITLTILTTLSRSGMLIALLLLILIAVKEKIYIFKILTIFFCIFISLLIVIIFFHYFVQSSYITTITARFESSELINTFGETRFVRGRAGLNAFFSNIIFGVGLGNLGHFLGQGIKHSERITSHSFYLDILASCGLLGFILISSLFVYIFYKLRKIHVTKYSQINFIIFAITCSLLLSQLVYNNLYHPVLAVQIGLILSYIKVNTTVKTSNTDVKDNI